MLIELTGFQIANENRPALREAIFEHFDEELPISGGWGYSAKDAIVIDDYDATKLKSVFSTDVTIQRNIVEKRLYEELFFSRPKNNRFVGFQWIPEFQSFIVEDEKRYTFLEVRGYCFLEEEFFALKNELMQGKDNPAFDLEKFSKKRLSMMYIFTSEYYFYIPGHTGELHIYFGS